MDALSLPVRKSTIATPACTASPALMRLGGASSKCSHPLVPSLAMGTQPVSVPYAQMSSGWSCAGVGGDEREGRAEGWSLGLGYKGPNGQGMFLGSMLKYVRYHTLDGLVKKLVFFFKQKTAYEITR